VNKGESTRKHGGLMGYNYDINDAAPMRKPSRIVACDIGCTPCFGMVVIITPKLAIGMVDSIGFTKLVDNRFSQSSTICRFLNRIRGIYKQWLGTLVARPVNTQWVLQQQTRQYITNLRYPPKNDKFFAGECRYSH
jgi:hypothetical protein